METREPALVGEEGSSEGCAHGVLVGVPPVCERVDDGVMVSVAVELALGGDCPEGFPEDPPEGFPEPPEGSSDGPEGGGRG